MLFHQILGREFRGLFTILEPIKSSSNSSFSDFVVFINLKAVLRSPTLCYFFELKRSISSSFLAWFSSLSLCSFSLLSWDTILWAHYVFFVQRTPRNSHILEREVTIQMQKLRKALHMLVWEYEHYLLFDCKNLLKIYNKLGGICHILSI